MSSRSEQWQKLHSELLNISIADAIKRGLLPKVREIDDERRRLIREENKDYIPQSHSGLFGIICDIEPFKDAGSGKTFTSRREWKDHLKVNGLQEKGYSDIQKELQTPKKKKELPPVKDDIVKALRKVKGYE